MTQFHTYLYPTITSTLSFSSALNKAFTGPGTQGATKAPVIAGCISPAPPQRACQRTWPKGEAAACTSVPALPSPALREMLERFCKSKPFHPEFGDSPWMAPSWKVCNALLCKTGKIGLSHWQHASSHGSGWAGGGERVTGKRLPYKQPPSRAQPCQCTCVGWAVCPVGITTLFVHYIAPGWELGFSRYEDGTCF